MMLLRLLLVMIMIMVVGMMVMIVMLKVMMLLMMMQMICREVCGDVPKQDCKLVPTSTNCKDIPEKLCRQRAYQYPESITRQVCGLGPSEPVGGKKGKGKKGRK